MDYIVGITHYGQMEPWQITNRWVQNMTIATATLGCPLGLVLTPTHFKEEYGDKEVDIMYEYDLPLVGEGWEKYMRVSRKSHRQDGCYAEIMVRASYNIWALLQHPIGTDDEHDVLCQNHAAMCSRNRMDIHIIAQRRSGYMPLAVAAGSSLNDGSASVKSEIIKRAKEENIDINE